MAFRHVSLLTGVHFPFEAPSINIDKCPLNCHSTWSIIYINYRTVRLFCAIYQPTFCSSVRTRTLIGHYCGNTGGLNGLTCWKRPCALDAIITIKTTRKLGVNSNDALSGQGGLCSMIKQSFKIQDAPLLCVVKCIFIYVSPWLQWFNMCKVMNTTTLCLKI